MMRIYLDNCCLNRPFDDQSDPRIHLEAEAVKTILALCEQGDWLLISSDVLQFEINNAPDPRRSDILRLVTTLAHTIVPLTDDIKQEAAAFIQAGIQTFDAYHLASAASNADVLLTTDDKFHKKAQQLEALSLTVVNPLMWLEEVLP